MVNQNKILSFEIKRKAKNVFPSDVKRTVTTSALLHFLVVLESVTSLMYLGVLSNPMHNLMAVLNSTSPVEVMVAKFR